MKPLRIVLTLALSFAACTVAHASVVYSNFGSPPYFDPQNGWVSDGGVVAGQELAVAFTPTATVGFTNAQLALGIIFSNLSQSPLSVYLASDNVGLPGTDIGDLMLDTGQSIGPFPTGNGVLFVCSGSCATLQAATQYWLVVAIPNLNSDYFNSQAEWNWNVTGDYVSENFAYNDTQFGTGWVLSDPAFLRPTFAINAEPTPVPIPIPPPNPIPEPSSLLLLASGALGVVGAAQRRYRA